MNASPLAQGKKWHLALGTAQSVSSRPLNLWVLSSLYCLWVQLALQEQGHLAFDQPSPPTLAYAACSLAVFRSHMRTASTPFKSLWVSPLTVHKAGTSICSRTALPLLNTWQIEHSQIIVMIKNTALICHEKGWGFFSSHKVSSVFEMPERAIIRWLVIQGETFLSSYWVHKCL